METRLELAVASSGFVGAWDWDVVADRVTSDERFAEFFGVDPAQAAEGVPIADFVQAIHADDVDRVTVAINEAMRGDGRYACDYRTVRTGGAVRWISAQGRCFFDDDGKPVRFTGVAVDITRTKLAESALAESEARFRASQELSLVPFTIMRAVRDGAGAVVDFEWEYANPAALTLLRATETELAGHRLLEKMPDTRHDPRLFPRYIRVLEGVDPGGEVELQFVADGLTGWFRNAAIRLDQDRIAVSFEDITVKKQNLEILERLVEDRTAELLRAADERRRAEEALRQGEKFAALGQLTGGVAHDFNNILQVVTSAATLLRRPNLSDERRTAVLDGLSKAAENARRLTGQLLAFSRKQALRPEAFDLNERLAGMSELLRHTLGPRVDVEARFAPDIWMAMADPGQLEVSVLNLAANARDAMPEGGTLRLVTENVTLGASADRPAGDFVRLSIQDTGGGMPRSVLQRAFEPFFTTKGPDRGTGLGLAQVFGFAKQSGGDVAIDSRLGEGTTVVLDLPRASVMEAHCALNAAGAPASGAAFERAIGKRVLVVEDNFDVANFACAMLEGLGYTTLRAGDAAQALEVLRTCGTIDAVFSDVVMPGEMNGVQLAVVLRQRHPNLGIVLTTGYSEMLSQWRGPVPAEVLKKPYRLDDLAVALERALAVNARVAS